MKRSLINRTIREAMEFFASRNFRLPPFAFFSRSDWLAHRAEAKEIFDVRLGWDVTGFGREDFEKIGLTLFTLRNGGPGYAKNYAEKIMMVREEQVTLLHHHWKKHEDIIVRGGGNLLIELYHVSPADSHILDGEFRICVDGMARRMRNGETLRLTPGESVCFEPCHAHRFYGERSRGAVLVGEVSMVNDDSTDNAFLDGAVRFDPIEEDEEPEYIPAADYEKFLGSLN